MAFARRSALGARALKVVVRATAAGTWSGSGTNRAAYWTAGSSALPPKDRAPSPPDELPGAGDGLERWCGHELHAAQVDSERSGLESDGA